MMNIVFLRFAFISDAGIAVSIYNLFAICSNRNANVNYMNISFLQYFYLKKMSGIGQIV
jgi:hypothetical protein